MNKQTKKMIEEGRSMVCGEWIIKNATNAYGENNGLGVYVFDRGGFVAEDLHLNEKTELLDPVDLDEAIAWCKSH